ncbi:hypothetical protein JCM1393_21710 [Clostridium carnis]
MLKERKFRKREEDLRRYRITVQVTSKEKDMLYSLAAKEGLTPSDYIRSVCIYKAWNNLFEKEEII